MVSQTPVKRANSAESRRSSELAQNNNSTLVVRFRSSSPETTRLQHEPSESRPHSASQVRPRFSDMPHQEAARPVGSVRRMYDSSASLMVPEEVPWSLEEVLLRRLRRFAHSWDTPGWEEQGASGQAHAKYCEGVFPHFLMPSGQQVHGWYTGTWRQLTDDLRAFEALLKKALQDMECKDTPRFNPPELKVPPEFVKPQLLQVEAHVPPTLPNNTVRKTKPRIVPKLIPKPERPTEAMLPPLPEMLEKPGVFVVPTPTPLPKKPVRKAQPDLRMPPKPQLTPPEMPAYVATLPAFSPDFEPVLQAAPQFSGVPASKLPPKPEDLTMTPFELKEPPPPPNQRKEKLAPMPKYGDVVLAQHELETKRSAEPQFPALEGEPDPPEIPNFRPPVVTTSGLWPPTDEDLNLPPRPEPPENVSLEDVPKYEPPEDLEDEEEEWNPPELLPIPVFSHPPRAPDPVLPVEFVVDLDLPSVEFAAHSEEDEDEEQAEEAQPHLRYDSQELGHLEVGASTLRSRSSRSSAASVSGASLTEVVFQAFAAYPAPPPPRWVVHARLQARRQEQDYQDWARGYLGEDDADARESAIPVESQYDLSEEGMFLGTSTMHEAPHPVAPLEGTGQVSFSRQALPPEQEEQDKLRGLTNSQIHSELAGGTGLASTRREAAGCVFVLDVSQTMNSGAKMLYAQLFMDCMLAESGVLVQAGVDFDVVAFSNCVHSWAQGSLPTNKFLTAPDACPARNQSVQVMELGELSEWPFAEELALGGGALPPSSKVVTMNDIRARSSRLLRQERKKAINPETWRPEYNSRGEPLMGSFASALDQGRNHKMEAELPSVSTTSVQNSVRTTEVGLLPSSPESVASARAWAHQWMLAANGSTSAAPALRSALRHRPEALFLLSDGLLQDAAAACEALAEAEEQGFLPAFVVVVGLDCSPQGRQNLRMLAQAFGEWSPELADLDTGGPAQPFFVIQKESAYSKGTLPPNVLVQLKEMIRLADQETRPARAGALEAANEVRAVHQLVAQHTSSRGDRKSTSKPLSAPLCRPKINLPIPPMVKLDANALPGRSSWVSSDVRAGVCAVSPPYGRSGDRSSHSMLREEAKWQRYEKKLAQERLGAGGAEVGDTFLTELPGGGGDERDEPSNTTGRDDEDEEGEDPDFDRLPAGRKATLEWHRFWSHPNMQLDTLPRIQHKHFYLQAMRDWVGSFHAEVRRRQAANELALQTAEGEYRDMMAERARRNAARLAEAHERFEAAKEDFETNVDAKYFASLAAWEDKRAELLVEAETAKRNTTATAEAHYRSQLTELHDKHAAVCAKIQAANHELVDQFRAEHAAWALEVVGIESKIERLKDLYVHQWAGAVVANTVERALVVEEHQRRSAKWSAYKSYYDAEKLKWDEENDHKQGLLREKVLLWQSMVRQIETEYRREHDQLCGRIKKENDAAMLQAKKLHFQACEEARAAHKAEWDEWNRDVRAMLETHIQYQFQSNSFEHAYKKACKELEAQHAVNIQAWEAECAAVKQSNKDARNQARTDHLNATRAAMERDEARVQAAEQNRRLMKEALVQYFEDCESVQRSNALKVAQHAASFACQLNVLFDKKRQKLHEALEQYQQRCGRLLQQNEDTLGAALRAHREVLSEVDDENRVALQGAQARHEMDLYMVEQYNAPRLAHVAWKQRMQAALAETALFVKQLNKYRTHIQNCGRKFTPHQKVEPWVLEKAMKALLKNRRQQELCSSRSSSPNRSQGHQSAASIDLPEETSRSHPSDYDLDPHKMHSHDPACESKLDAGKVLRSRSRRTQRSTSPAGSGDSGGRLRLLRQGGCVSRYVPSRMDNSGAGMPSEQWLPGRVQSARARRCKHPNYEMRRIMSSRPSMQSGAAPTPPCGMPDQDIQLALPSAVGPARPRPAPRLSLEVASPAGEACVSLPFVMSTEEVVAVDPKLRVLGASRPRAHRTCKVGVAFDRPAASRSRPASPPPVGLFPSCNTSSPSSGPRIRSPLKHGIASPAAYADGGTKASSPLRVQSRGRTRSSPIQGVPNTCVVPGSAKRRLRLDELSVASEASGDSDSDEAGRRIVPASHKESQDDGRRSANSKGTSSRVHEEATCGSNSQMASLGFQGALGKIPNARFVTRPRKTGIVFARPAKQTAIQAPLRHERNQMLQMLALLERGGPNAAYVGEFANPVARARTRAEAVAAQWWRTG